MPLLLYPEHIRDASQPPQSRCVLDEFKTHIKCISKLPCTWAVLYINDMTNGQTPKCIGTFADDSKFWQIIVKDNEILLEILKLRVWI